ncbi:response regulator [Thalassobaculum sp.]|uniref:response regulator n=1 Tax=Thalassobaculum sp. TaxID=2022740 RepID=UPI0032F037C3
MSDASCPQLQRSDGPLAIIVEDESLVALYLEDALDTLGFRCCGIARSADQAVSMVETYRPAVALVDIGLAGKRDGVSLARELTDRFGTAVVFLSGSDDQATRQRAASARPHGFLSKPCTEHEIASALDSVLTRSAATEPSPDG